MGVIDEEDFFRTFTAASAVLLWTFFREAWPTLQVSFDPGFIEFLEAEIIP